MRSFCFCLSLALLLCLQAYAEQPQYPLAGTWSSPQKKFDTGADCCVPDSIEIVKSDSDYKGTYSYAGMRNLKCWNMFLLSSGRDVEIVKKPSSDAYGISVKLIDRLPIEGYRVRVISSSQLEIYNPANTAVDEASTCLFTMTEFKPASGPTSSFSLLISYIVMSAGVVLLLLVIACKCRQKKQIVIIQQESSYGRPNMYHATQL